MDNYYHDWMLMRGMVLALVFVVFMGLAVLTGAWQAWKRKHTARRPPLGDVNGLPEGTTT